MSEVHYPNLFSCRDCGAEGFAPEMHAELLTSPRSEEVVWVPACSSCSSPDSVPLLQVLDGLDSGASMYRLEVTCVGCRSTAIVDHFCVEWIPVGDDEEACWFMCPRCRPSLYENPVEEFDALFYPGTTEDVDVDDLAVDSAKGDSSDSDVGPQSFLELIPEIRRHLETLGFSRALDRLERIEELVELRQLRGAEEELSTMHSIFERMDLSNLSANSVEGIRTITRLLGEAGLLLPPDPRFPRKPLRFVDLPPVLRDLVVTMIDRAFRSVGSDSGQDGVSQLKAFRDGLEDLTQSELAGALNSTMRTIDTKKKA